MPPSGTVQGPDTGITLPRSNSTAHKTPPGGGHLSGRLTAPLCIAGGICLQLLAREGVAIAAHIQSIGEQEDLPFDPQNVDKAQLRALLAGPFPSSGRPPKGR